MRKRRESEKLLEHNKQYIPGGVVSVNRATKPEISFVRGEGAYIWDADNAQYLDYHAAFGPHFLGHNDPYVTEAVLRVLRERNSLFGSGTTRLEGELAELICTHVPAAESVQFLNTGSEATYQAIRLGVCRELRVSRHRFERGCRWKRAIRSSGRRLLEPCPIR